MNVEPLDTGMISMSSIMVRFQLSDDVNHFYVTYTVDLFSVTENILFYTIFYPKIGLENEGVTRKRSIVNN